MKVISVDASGFNSALENGSALELFGAAVLAPRMAIIAGAHPLVRFGIGQLLKKNLEFSAVIEASNQAELAASLLDSTPELVIIQDPGPTALCRNFFAAQAAPNVVFASAPSGKEIASWLASGVDGILDLRLEATSICDCLLQVMNGERIVKLACSSTFIEAEHARFASVIARLTPRQKEVLTMVAAGLKNDDIAAKLQVKPTTAKAHVFNVSSALKAPNRVVTALYGRAMQRLGIL